MKKTVLIAFSLTAALIAKAEGYQVNTLSAKQLGMGHTGAALHLGAESQIFNPAGTASMDSKFDITATGTIIIPKATATVGSVDYHNNDTKSTPLAVNLAGRLNDNVTLGVSFYTPYGSCIEWPDNWPGAVANQNVKMEVYTVQPTVAWRPVKNFSLGLGVMVTWGHVNLNKALVDGNSLNPVLAMLGSQYRFEGNDVPAALNLDGGARVTGGVNIGAMWDITDRITVGTSWRSQQPMTVKGGKAHLTYQNDVAKTILDRQIGAMHEATFQGKMPAPWVYNVGISAKPVDALTIALDWQLTGWKAYKSLDITFPALEQTNPKLAHQSLTKDYKNVWALKFGAQYDFSRIVTGRLGVMYDRTPVNRQHYNPETPGANKIEPTVGLSLRPCKGLSVDAAFMYVIGKKVNDGTYTYTDAVLGTERSFVADYKVTSSVISVGLSYKF